MIAIPLIPGLAYRVRGAGLDLKVIAANGADAILTALDFI